MLSIFGKAEPVPGQWMLVADDQTVRFEAQSEEAKEKWMSVLAQCRDEQVEAKQGRKFALRDKRLMAIEERKREAERRKQAVLSTCSGGGMTHTAQAMMRRV